ncbi:protein prenylyltransferase [Aulographum hederae CBS 113979]|uniref:Geranylgeranyl transferase type-2 subunit alpha n=1 Tax=Aulographum hederae CBS 113979 TaxID=1176131 RepID=A0A6G1HFA3_9PEZI|nr:protein prenylyltransferase [Aulographum hederae CBS 113979]
MSGHGVPRVSAADDTRDAQKEQKKIEEYRTIVDLVNAKIAEREYTLEVLSLTEKVLKKNPEYYTVWNYRRLILQFHIETALTNNHDASISQDQPSDGRSPAQDTIHNLLTWDLSFIIPLLMQFPKCYWIWKYRLWLLSRATDLLPASWPKSLWNKELELVSKMLARDERNFHGWGYRRTIIASLEKIAQEGGDGESNMVEQEFEYTTRMIKSNLSNFSAWHNRSKLIPRLLDERGANNEDRRDMLDSEFSLIQEAMTDPDNQSVFFYHQFLMSTLSPTNPRHAAIALDLTNTDRVAIYEREIENIKELLEDFDDCKLIYQILLQYTKEYLDFEAGNKTVTTAEMREWLAQLRKLDFLRNGRWNDVERDLGL